jgi:hypothetical protein
MALPARARTVARMCSRYPTATLAAPVPTAVPAPEQRIGDEDRERASTELRRHFTEGRLDTDEFSARLEEAWAAKTGADLDHALRNLPRPPVGPPPAGPHRRRPPTFLPVVAVVIGVAALAGARWAVVWLLAAAVFVLLRIRAAGLRSRAGR